MYYPIENIEYFKLNKTSNIAKFFNDYDKVKYGLRNINIYESHKIAKKDFNNSNL